jgi:hypothetical protein
MAGHESLARHDVVVEQQHDVSRGSLEAYLLRPRLPAVLDEDGLQSRLALGDLLEILERSVTASVDDDDDLDRSRIGEERSEDVG